MLIIGLLLFVKLLSLAALTWLEEEESQFCYYKIGQEFNITYQDLNVYLNRCINYITDHDEYHITTYKLTNDIPLHLVKTTQSNNLSMKE